MKQTEEDGWRGFLALCLKVQSESELDELFGLMLTACERTEIANRYLILRDLIQGKKTQREIAKDLNTSIAKVSRGSNSLKIFRNDLRRLFEE
jgi:TrpR family trp operon transcriptional repressor